MATTTMIQSIVDALQQQRHALDMPYGVLAKRTGLGVSTVQRALHGEVGRLETVASVAAALGVRLGVVSKASPNGIRHKQASVKARRLAGIVQGSSALEGQAVSADALCKIEQRIKEKLLGGPAGRLWGE